MEKLTKKEKTELRSYAEALQDLMREVTGENACAKRSDPMEFGSDYIHSYAFNLKDGTRIHPLKDYESISEIKKIMLKEATDWIKDDIN